MGWGDFTVNNSQEFVAVILDISMSSDEQMVSFDVRSLYTSLPVRRTLQVVRERLRNDETLESRILFKADEVTELLEICLTSTYSTFQRKKFGWCGNGLAGIISGSEHLYGRLRGDGDQHGRAGKNQDFEKDL